MREICTYGSEEGGARQRALPTPIRDVPVIDDVSR